MTTTNQLKIYIAGPITGKSGAEIVASFNEKRAILSDIGYEVFSPMAGKEFLQEEETLKPAGYLQPVSTDQAIFHRDRWMVGIVDIVLADLSNSGKRVSIGTMFELAWANILQKQIVLVLPENNVHDHAFVKQSATIIFPNILDAYDYLKELSESRTWEVK